MKVSVSFDELEKVANEKLNTGALSFSQVDDKTVRVTYKLFLPVTVDLKIEGLVGHDLLLSYTGGAAAGIAVKSLLAMTKEKPEMAFVEAVNDYKLLVHLDQIEKVRPVFEKIGLEEINVMDGALEAVGKLL